MPNQLPFYDRNLVPSRFVFTVAAAAGLFTDLLITSLPAGSQGIITALSIEHDWSAGPAATDLARARWRVRVPAGPDITIVSLGVDGGEGFSRQNAGWLGAVHLESLAQITVRADATNSLVGITVDFAMQMQTYAEV